jgi:hypothetical protein
MDNKAQTQLKYKKQIIVLRANLPKGKDAKPRV